MPRPDPATSPRFMCAIEAAGVRQTAHHWALVPPELARRLRTDVVRVGDGVLTVAGASESLRMNRVIGFGHRGQAREGMIDEMIARFRVAKRRRFCLRLGPVPQAGRIAGWLLARGFTRGPGLSLLVRDARLAVPRARSRVRVARARRADEDAILAIHERCFATPVRYRPWGRAALRDGGAEHLVAFVGSARVAVGAVRVDGDLAWVGSGATLTRWRRHGAHAALIAARLRRARRLGCRWAWVETTVPAPRIPAVSHRNLLRFGFRTACVKPDFIWEER